jgi:methylase of polypeptide subunit release factors
LQPYRRPAKLAAMTDAASYPIRIGRPEEFARVRDFFRAADFNDADICRLLAIETMSDIGGVDWSKVARDAMPPALGWCIDTFVRGAPPPAAKSSAICGEAVFAAFQSLGLLRPAKRDADALVSPIWLYPIDDFIMVSDRHDDPDGGDFVPADDIVFPALHAGMLTLMRLLPPTKGDALDLCGGAGLGALHLSRTARVAATADITPRSAFFADFNARLNGVAIESLCGDLYAPATGRQFDVISAHPPYVPAVESHLIFRDGGDTGEDIIRRVIEGLPAHLRAGGTAVIFCTARDTSEATFEQRARGWLGAAGVEFDIVMGADKVRSIAEIVAAMRQRKLVKTDEQAQLVTMRMHAADTRAFASGALVLRRYGRVVPEPPLRLVLLDDVTYADFDRVFAWRDLVRRDDARVATDVLAPRLAEGIEVDMRSVVHAGALAPTEVVFLRRSGFRSELKLDARVAPLIIRFDGEHSVASIFAAARDAGDITRALTLTAFSDLVRMMIERGLLEIDRA